MNPRIEEASSQQRDSLQKFQGEYPFIVHTINNYYYNNDSSDRPKVNPSQRLSTAKKLLPYSVQIDNSNSPRTRRFQYQTPKKQRKENIAEIEGFRYEPKKKNSRKEALEELREELVDDIIQQNKVFDYFTTPEKKSVQI